MELWDHQAAAAFDMHSAPARFVAVSRGGPPTGGRYAVVVLGVDLSSWLNLEVM